VAHSDLDGRQQAPDDHARDHQDSGEHTTNGPTTITGQCRFHDDLGGGRRQRLARLVDVANYDQPTIADSESALLSIMTRESRHQYSDKLGKI
jgi:hypothetical protein